MAPLFFKISRYATDSIPLIFQRFVLILRAYTLNLGKYYCSFFKKCPYFRLASNAATENFKNHKIFEKKSQDLDSKSQVYKIKLLLLN